MAQVEICSGCNGKGFISCRICDGRGSVTKIGNSLGNLIGVGVETVECQTCQGTGRLLCTMCGGVGKILAEKTKTSWI